MEFGVTSTLINDKHQSRRERGEHEEKTKAETTPRSEKEKSTHPIIVGCHDFIFLLHTSLIFFAFFM
jgi:hypothetical protein